MEKLNKALSKKLLYLSGAPRVSTRGDSLANGPRNHVLGTLEGFSDWGWDFDTFIAGNAFGGYFSRHQLEEFTQGKKSRKVVMDLTRIVGNKIGQIFLGAAYQGPYYFCYERYGLFQSLGSKAKKKMGNSMGPRDQ